MLIFLGVVGPLVAFLILGMLIYLVRKPRVKGVKFEEGPSVAQIGADGQPIFPPGLPTAAAMPSSTSRARTVASAATMRSRSSARCAAWAARPSSTPAPTAASC